MKKRFYFVTLFGFILYLSVYARGNTDYSHAEELLEAKKNEAALEEIGSVFESKPESAEAAVYFARKTMKNQEQFREKFNELLQLLYEDPDNNEKKLALIMEIEKSESDMEPLLVDFLAKLKVSSIYAIQRIRFNIIMDEGIALINENRYNEAAETFIKGYSIHNEKFQSENADTRLQAEVNNEINSVKAGVKKYAASYAKFISAEKKLSEKIKAETGVFSEKDFLELQLALNELRAVTDSVSSSGSILKRIYSEEIKKSISADETLLPFAYRLTIGRSSATEFEGVEGAMDAGIYLNINSFIENYWHELRSLFENACNTLNFENNAPIENSIALMNIYLNYLQKWYAVRAENSKSRFIKKTNNNYSARIDAFSHLIGMISNTKKLYSEFLPIEKNKNKIASDYTVSVYELRDEKNILVTALQNAADEINTIAQNASKLFTETAKYKKDGAEYEADFLQVKQNLFLENISALKINLFEQLALLKNKSGKIALEASKSEYDEYHKYTIKTENENTAVSPVALLQKLSWLKQTVEQDSRLLTAFTERSDIKSPDLNASSAFSANITEIKKTVAALKELSAAITNDTAYFNSMFLKIQLAKNEAELRYEQAQNYFKKGNFNAAREYIELSRIKTNEALLLEDDAEYRAMTDERLDKLGVEINDAENELVVKDVRNYLEKAKKHYFNGEFQSAEDTLISARNRWAVTHVEQNEEVTNWLNIVSTAGALKTGRTVPVSAPLYPQIVQLLNNSTQLYLDSVKKINSAEHEQALENLKAAKENIKQVLLLYPFNETAGQLNLKIDKLIDPVNFYEQFRKKIATVRKEYKSNSQRAYSDLLDLYSIDKNFSGIAALKDEIEIYLGIKLPPPDLKAIAESAELTRSARKIYNTRNTFEFIVAVQQLDRAIKLDLQNIEAVRLKDEIQTAMGGASVIVLSAANESKYQQAVAELQKGNKIIAAALVEQLMQNANARNSAKVRELKKRIDALL